MKSNILCCAHICFCLLSVSERDTNATLRWGQSKTEEGKQSKDEKWSSRGATSSKSRHGTANINYPILLVKASFFLIKELRNWDLTLYWRLAWKCNFVMAPLDHIVINLITTEQMLRMWSCTTTIYLYFVSQIFVKINKYTQGLIIPNHVLVYLCVSQVSHISAGWMSTPLSGFHLCRAFCILCCEQVTKNGDHFYSWIWDSRISVILSTEQGRWDTRFPQIWTKKEVKHGWTATLWQKVMFIL